MNITDWFLRHPVAALVLNALLVLTGFLSLQKLGLREYPEVSFPQISVRTAYPNASPELVESALTNVLEDGLAGVSGLDTMTSRSREGMSLITLDFRADTPMEAALTAVREAVGNVRARLPLDVREPAIERQSAQEGLPFMVVTVTSPGMAPGSLTHYANLNLKNALRSIQGVGSVDVWGQPYTWKVLLDARQMHAFGVNADEVWQALKNADEALPAGKFRNGVPIVLNGGPQSAAEYRRLVIKPRERDASGHLHPPVHLADIASVSLATDDSGFRVRVNGKPGICLAIEHTNDANPLAVSEAVKQLVGELRHTLPDGMQLKVIVDEADYVRQSLANIYSSILEAVLIVMVIVFGFLRNLRATLVPLVTIPISLLGGVIFLKVFGYSLNLLTLMAMVLAVGLVVDDAIVVLENIQRQREAGKSAFQASLEGARETGFAIIAMTLTLASVYAPLAFMSGLVGQFFAEFAVALAGSVLISGVVALTLSPLMCMKTLKAHATDTQSLIGRLAARYSDCLAKLLERPRAILSVLGASLLASLLFVCLLPNETAPSQDRGLVGIYMPPVPGGDLNTMEAQSKLVEALAAEIPEANDRLVFMGEWGGNVVLPLKPLDARKRAASQIVDALRPQTTTLASIDAWPWAWDTALPGVESGSPGDALSVAVSTTGNYRALYDTMNTLRATLSDNPRFDGVRHNLKLDTPGYRVDIDREALSSLNLNARQIAKTVEVFLSADKTIPFSRDGVPYAMTLTGKRMPWGLEEMAVTNPEGKRISLAAVASLVPSSGPEALYHHNQMRAAVLSAGLGAKVKPEKAMADMEAALAKPLEDGFRYTWMGAARALQDSRSTLLTLFALALVFIYAILSVQFENFLDPFIILVTVPLAAAGALALVWLCGQSLNIYTQVGLVTLVGLITKHGILIVSFVNQLLGEGEPLVKAVVEASSRRLRPVIMTSGAMFFGALPLAFSHGAGFEARRALGIVLAGGLGFGTLFTLFVLPPVCFMMKSKWNKSS